MGEAILPPTNQYKRGDNLNYDKIAQKYPLGVIPYMVSIYEAKFNDDLTVKSIYDLELTQEESIIFDESKFDRGLYTFLKRLATQKMATGFLYMIGMFEDNLIRVFNDTSKNRKEEDVFLSGRIRF